MTSLKQIQANRRNALHSTGPTTPEGKLRSRCNAVRHGLTAETVIGTLEDADDYQAFELAVTSGYDARSAVERELVLRLASVLWRLRRATAIETALFEIAALANSRAEGLSHPTPHSPQVRLTAQSQRTRDIAQCFLRMLDLPGGAFPLLTRYEHTLWRQARQLVLTLESLRRRHYAKPRQFRPAIADDAETSKEDL
jgi:hypothetical protein